jgi:hypothetical protein
MMVLMFIAISEKIFYCEMEAGGCDAVGWDMARGNVVGKVVVFRCRN